MSVAKPTDVPRWADGGTNTPTNVVAPPEHNGSIAAWAPGPYTVASFVGKGGNYYIVTAIAGTGTSTTGPTGTGTTVDNPGANQVTWSFVTTTPVTKDSGWLPGIQPPAQFFNWIFFVIYQWILWLQDLANQNFTANGSNPVGPWANTHFFAGGNATYPAVQIQPPNATSGNGYVGLVVTGGTPFGTNVSGPGIVVYPGDPGAGSTDYALVAHADTLAAIHATGDAAGEGIRCDGGTIAGTGVAGRFNGNLTGAAIICTALGTGNAIVANNNGTAATLTATNAGGGVCAGFVATIGSAVACVSSGGADTATIGNTGSTGRAINCLNHATNLECALFTTAGSAAAVKAVAGTGPAAEMNGGGILFSGAGSQTQTPAAHVMGGTQYPKAVLVLTFTSGVGFVVNRHTNVTPGSVAIVGSTTVQFNFVNDMADADYGMTFGVTGDTYGLPHGLGTFNTTHLAGIGMWTTSGGNQNFNTWTGQITITIWGEQA